MGGVYGSRVRRWYINHAGYGNWIGWCRCVVDGWTCTWSSCVIQRYTIRVVRAVVRMAGYLTSGTLVAAGEGIAGVRGLAVTNGIVVVDTTLGINATGSWTRIDALVLYARLVEATLRVESTLRTTIGWTAKEVGKARADRLIVTFATLGIGSTG